MRAARTRGRTAGWTTGAATLALAVALAGCSGEQVTERLAEEAVEQLGDGEAELDLDADDGDGVGISTEDGTLQSGGSLPESFPDGLPLPPDDFDVGPSYEQRGDDGDGFELQVALLTTGTVDDLSDYYQQALTDAGYDVEEVNRISQDELESSTLGARGSEHNVLLQIVSSDEGEVMVNYGIGPPDEQ